MSSDASDKQGGALSRRWKTIFSRPSTAGASLTSHPALPVVSEEESRAHATCVACPSLCRSACPVAEVEATETTAPQRLMSLASLLAQETISPEVMADKPYHCTSCGACVEACLHDNNVPLWMLAARHRLFEYGLAPPAVAEAAAYFGVAGNQYGQSCEPALRNALDAAGTEISRKGLDVYLAGCETLHSQPQLVTSAFQLMANMSSVDLTATTASALCCGAPLAWAGERTGFVSHASRFASVFGNTRRIVAHDPACAHALRVLYPYVGVEMKPEIWTLYGSIADQVGGISPLSSMRRDYMNAGPDVGYRVFEPCHLARSLGERDRTRALVEHLLGDGWSLLHHNGINDCCGAAGMLPLSAPGTAWELAQQKIQAFTETKAHTLISLSPRCGAHLRRVAPDLNIKDLAEVVQQTAGELIL